MKDNSDVIAEEESMEFSSPTLFNGQVIRNHEGENVLEYTLSLPETATTSIEMDGALIKVSDQGVPLVEMYASYEGARGYSASDYINNNIAPAVKAITSVGTTTIGLYEWDVVESENSIWHVGRVGDGRWLMVIESRKIDSEIAYQIIESLDTK